MRGCTPLWELANINEKIKLQNWLVPIKCWPQSNLNAMLAIVSVRVDMHGKKGDATVTAGEVNSPNLNLYLW